MSRYSTFLIAVFTPFKIKDPIGKAYVMSRGIVGDINGEMCVASPLYKQHFSLKSGQCLEDEAHCLKTWRVTVDDNQVCYLAKE